MFGQDAHEFCISVLDGLHSSCIISPLSAGNSANDHDRRDARVGRECPCVVHKTFAAQLRSDLTCSACAATSTAVDPILDVSLDLKRPSTLPGAASAEVGSSLLVAGAGTLVGENLIDLPVGGHGGKDIGISLSASGAASPASASPRVHLANDLALVPSLLLRASSVSGLENDSSSFLPNLEYDDENISEMVLSSHSHSHSPDLILSEMNDMAGSPVMGLPLSTTAVTIDSSDSGSSPSSTSAMGDGMPAFDAPACGGVANDGAKVAKPVAKNAGKITAGAARIALPVQTFSTSLEECLDRRVWRGYFVFILSVDSWIRLRWTVVLNLMTRNAQSHIADSREKKRCTPMTRLCVHLAKAISRAQSASRSNLFRTCSVSNSRCVSALCFPLFKYLFLTFFFALPLAAARCSMTQRFEHHGILKSKRMSSKIDVYVKFPIDGLDMSPYMYQNIAGFVAG